MGGARSALLHVCVFCFNSVSVCVFGLRVFDRARTSAVALHVLSFGTSLFSVGLSVCLSVFCLSLSLSASVAAAVAAAVRVIMHNSKEIRYPTASQRSGVVLVIGF